MRRRSSSHVHAHRGPPCHARDGSIAVAIATIVPISRAKLMLRPRKLCWAVLLLLLSMVAVVAGGCAAVAAQEGPAPAASKTITDVSSHCLPHLPQPRPHRCPRRLQSPQPRLPRAFLQLRLPPRAHRSLGRTCCPIHPLRTWLTACRTGGEPLRASRRCAPLAAGKQRPVRSRVQQRHSRYHYVAAYKGSDTGLSRAHLQVRRMGTRGGAPRAGDARRWGSRGADDGNAVPFHRLPSASADSTTRFLMPGRGRSSR